MASLDLARALCCDVLENMTACPVCGETLGVSQDSKSLVCPNRHCFDGGAGGYVSLVRRGGGGDSKEAVAARKSFLEKGYYAPAAQYLCDVVGELVAKEGRIVDAGCGEGYYSNLIADCGYHVFGADISKFAACSAAKSAGTRRMERGAH